MTPSTEMVAQIASLPFDIVAQLGVACGYERSFKMRRNSLLANRYMLGVDTEGLTPEQLLNVCQRMDMPKAYLDSFAENASEANLVFLGFEHDGNCCHYKIYLEFWEKIKQGIRDKTDRQEPVLLHLGYKWDTNDNRHRAIARYTCHPQLTVQGILSRISKIYDADHDETSHDETSLAIVADIIKLAASTKQNISPIYLEAEEEGNPRVSFDVNIYSAALAAMCWSATARRRRSVTTRRTKRR